MDAACTPPHQNKRKTARNNRRRHIPAEVVEEILLNLPVKSLVRFSCVSRSWRSMISEPGFVKRYRGRAALPGRERIVITASRRDYLKNALSCPLSSISSSDQSVDHQDIATEIIFPIPGTPSFAALCDELLCLEVGDSLFLWNPSMNTYKKVPHHPPLLPPTCFHYFVYGLGYDAVGDDYKILKLPLANRSIYRDAELYSLRGDSWRKIQPFPVKETPKRKCVCVSGALHWMAYDNGSHVIVSFDLSTEKYGEVALPRYTATEDGGGCSVEMTALRGMLCVFLNYYKFSTFVLWAMLDYGDDKSWTKTYGIQYSDSIPYFTSRIRRRQVFTLIPLHFNDDGDILIKVCSDGESEIYMYKKEEAMPKKIVGRGKNISDVFLYVESLISPATWSRTSSIHP